MWYEFSKNGSEVIIKHPRTIGVRWIRNEEAPEILWNPDNNPDLTLVKVDNNGTKHYKSNICPSCNGCGKVYLGMYSDEYQCDKCSGTGKLPRSKTYKIHTHEYGLILEKEYLKEKHKKFFEKHAINEDGSTYVYIGNTYEVKDELKLKGAKYGSPLYKWHSKELIDGFNYIKVVVPLKTYADGSFGYDYGYDDNDCNKRINTLLDDVMSQIRIAEKELKI